MTETATPPRSRGRDTRRARARGAAAKYPYIRRKLKPVELLSTEAIEIIEANAETILEEVGIEFRRDPESLRLWKEAGADVTRRARPHPARHGAAAARHRAGGVRALRPQPRAQRALRRRCDRLLAGGRPAVRDRPRARPALRHARGPAQLHQARPHGAGDPLLRRLHVRADGDRAEQAPPRHPVRLLPLLRPGVRSDPGDRRSRGRCRGDGADAVRRSVPREPSGHARQHQLQFPAGVRRPHARGAAPVRLPQPGHDRRARGAGRRHGSGDPRRLPGGDPRRDARRHGAHAAGAPGGTGDPRLLRRGDLDAHRRADLRHARGDPDDLRDRAAGAAPEGPLPQRRLAVRLEDRRCPGGLRECAHAAADAARGSEPRDARGRLARGGARGRATRSSSWTSTSWR